MCVVTCGRESHVPLVVVVIDVCALFTSSWSRSLLLLLLVLFDIVTLCFQPSLGALVFDAKDVELTSKWVRVDSGGALIIGAESCLFTNKVNYTATLVTFVRHTTTH